MKISIITVCYNSEKTIVRTIESLLSQENVELEYLIIDVKSTDRTLEIAESFRKCINASSTMNWKENWLHNFLHLKPVKILC